MKGFLLTVFFFCCTHFLWAQSKVVVNNGEGLTNKKSINLTLNVYDAKRVRVSENIDFTDVEWQAFTRHPDWTLTDGDGLKIIYVQFEGADGKVSNIQAAEIFLDTTPPSNTRIRHIKGYYSRSTRVNLEILADGALEMALSPSNEFKNPKWLTYSKFYKNWMLPKGDGRKFIYAIFRDKAGNISEPCKTFVNLDTEPPIAKFVKIDIEGMIYDSATQLPYINKSQKFINLEVEAEDAAYMRVNDNRNFFNVHWRLYTDYFEDWQVDKGGEEEVLKKVYVQFRDKAGNQSEILHADIVIDHNPPLDGRISINTPSDIINDPNVELDLFARGANEMMIVNNETFKGGKWQPYQKKTQWKLENEDTSEEKNVFVKFRDRAHNVSEVYETHINYDVTPPLRCALSIERGKKETFKHNVKVLPKADDAMFMKLSTAENFETAPWIGYRHRPIPIELDPSGGMKVIKAQFRDRAGNVTEVIQDSILLAIKPMYPYISINEGGEFSNSIDRLVTLNLHAAYADEMMVSNKKDMTGETWQPYREEIPWELSEGGGEKSVFVKFRSITKTESRIVHDKIILDNTPPENGKIKIELVDNKHRVFYVKDVYLTPFAEGAVAMQFSESKDFKDAAWKGYSPIRMMYGVNTVKKEGERTIYARYRDMAGNVSPPVSSTFYFDSKKPNENLIHIEPSMRNPNYAPKEKATASHEVEVKIHSNGALMMRLSEDRYWKDVNWHPYGPVGKFTLSKGDGVKTLYAQFKDENGNLSRIVSDQIILDTKAPEKDNITVSSGEFCTRLDRRIKLNLLAWDASVVVLSNNSSFEDASYLPYRNKMDWYLSEGDGAKEVYYKFVDFAGNETEVKSFSVTLDRGIPEGEELLINGNNEITKDKTVSLTINATGAYEMLITNTKGLDAYAKWEPYSRRKEWKLRGADGKKTVYVRLRDKAGNESEVMSGSIELDTQHPILYEININKGVTVIDKPQVDVFTKVSADAREMQLSNSLEFDGDKEWIIYSPRVSWTVTGTGLRSVYVRFKDEAGNISKPLPVKVMVYEK